ncbi:hypothetical protein [Gottschalkia acidurici]|nr:hypothetical protein [Gottschalkia acidurici]
MEKVIYVKPTKYLKVGIVLKGAEIIMASGVMEVDTDDLPQIL